MSGSGVVVGENEILTNKHVVNGAARVIQEILVSILQLK